MRCKSDNRVTVHCTLNLCEPHNHSCLATAGNDTYEYGRPSAIRYLGDSSTSMMLGLTQDSVQSSSTAQAPNWSQQQQQQQRTSFSCPQVMHIFMLFISQLIRHTRNTH